MLQRLIEATRKGIPDLREFGAKNGDDAREVFRVQGRLLALIGVAVAADIEHRTRGLSMALQAMIKTDEREIAEALKAAMRNRQVEAASEDFALSAALYFNEPPPGMVVRKHVSLTHWRAGLERYRHEILATPRDVEAQVGIAKENETGVGTIRYTEPGLDVIEVEGLDLLAGALPLNSKGELSAEENMSGCRLPTGVLACEHGAVLTRRIEDFTEISEPVVVMTDFSSFNRSYFHFLLQFLPRLALLHLRDSISGRKFLVTDELPRWARDLIVRPGFFREEDLISIRPGVNVRLSNALLMTPAAMQRMPQSDELNALRALLALGADPDRAHSRYFIPRAHVGRRVMINEPEIIDEARRCGFEILRPEELSVEEQIGRFSGAKVIAGPSGGGLSNMAFAPPGGHVISLTPRDRQRWPFAANAHALGHTFTFALGRLLMEDTPSHMSILCPFLVDPRTFRRAIEAVA